jgi:hypothetical protein
VGQGKAIVMYRSINEAIVDQLRRSGVGNGAIVWASPDEDMDGVGSPYYDEVPEPPPPYPYVFFTIPDSDKEDNFDGGWIEIYRPTITVVGLVANIQEMAMPSIVGSVHYFLDQFHDTPDVFSGDGYTCESFVRHSFSLRRDQFRGPSGERVWTGIGVYEVRTFVLYRATP